MCQPAVATDVVREVADRIAALDGDAVVLDVTDGWAAWSLVGDDAAHALSYLSQLDAPQDGGFVQGDVAHVGSQGAGRARWPHDPRPRLLARASAGASGTGCAG